MENRVTLTMKEQHKLKMVIDYEARKVQAQRAAELLGITKRQFLELKKGRQYNILMQSSPGASHCCQGNRRRITRLLRTAPCSSQLLSCLAPQPDCGLMNIHEKTELVDEASPGQELVRSNPLPGARYESRRLCPTE